MPQKAEKQTEKKFKSHIRKISVDKLLSSYDTSHSSIRGIVNYSTNTLPNRVKTPNPNYIPNNRVTLFAQKQDHHDIQNLKEQLIQSLRSSFREPMRRIQKQGTEMSFHLQKIRIEPSNLHKNRNQEIKIQVGQFANWKLWLGNVFEEICERAFQMYVNEELQYDQMRSFCAQKILINLVQFFKKDQAALQSNTCIQWQKQVKKIVDHLCNKYPQVEKVQINKKLQQVVNKNKINNFQSEDYDLIDKTRIQFNFKPSGDYTEQIMRFVNEIIMVTQKQVGRGKSLFNNFHTFFSNVFALVYHKDKSKDMSILHNQTLNDYEYCRYRFQEEQDIEYNEKVKTYTNFVIGSKIPLNSGAYSQDQMVSGIIDIKTKPVARVIDKWVDQLRQKISNPEKFIMQRTHRFKGHNPGDRVKLTQKQKQILCQKVKQEKLNIQKFDEKIKQNIDEVSQMLLQNLQNCDQLTFLEPIQRAMGEFACKMELASVQYSVQKLNSLIGGLMRSVEKMKNQINKTKPYSFIGDDVQLNLVTCKIGDLLRCKFTSKEDQVIRIFEFLMTLSQSNYMNMFKIIRIKNRLGQSTRDILINALFKNEIVCEIQLAINEGAGNKKQKYMDKFNHFLYEVRRAQMGSLLELCTIWVNNCPKSQTFKKAIKYEIQMKSKHRVGVCQNTIFKFENNKFQVQKLPFICQLCKIFYTGQRMIFGNVLFEDYKQPVCGECLATRVQKTQRLKYFFSGDDKPQHVANFMAKFCMQDAIKQVFTLQQLRMYDFYIMVPIHSKRINKSAVRRLQTKQMTFLIENYLTDDGKLEMKLRYQFCNIKTFKQQEKYFFQKYCLFTFTRPVGMKQIQFCKNNFTSMLQKDLKKIHIYQQKNNNRLQSSFMQFPDQNILFTHYRDPTICEITRLKNQMNVLKIIQSAQDSKQVIELSNRKIRQQFQILPPGIKIKMNTILRQLYLDQNLLEDLSFVSPMYTLQILTAKNNQLKQIPQMPANLEILDLSQNFIQKIQGFTQSSYSKMRVISISHNLITKIENLQQVPNLLQLLLNGNRIKVIQGLNQLKKLTKLVLSQNPIHTVQNLETLQSIEYLSLGKSQINLIQNLNSLNKLETLILDEANVEIRRQLKLPSKLKKLNLNNNKIKSMNSFKSLENIEQLMLNQNMIKHIQTEDWLQNIKLLNLSNNHIEEIPELKILVDLKQLYLAHNSISELKGLDQNLYLTVLDVSFNKLSELKNIRYMLNLNKLLVKNNQIKKIQAFQNLKSLQQLQLANNFISQVLVSFPQSLRRLNLQNNKITEISWITKMIQKANRITENGSGLEEVILKSNPIPQIVIMVIHSLLDAKGAKLIM